MSIKICCMSDTHSRQGLMKDIEPSDILLHAGDVSMMGYRHEILDFIEWFESQPALHRVWIGGNHDLSLEEDPRPEWLQEVLAGLDTNTHYLQDSGVEIMGVKIWGCPWQPEFCNWAFNLPRGERLREKYDLMPEDTDVLIVHGPPYSYFDEVPERYRQIGQEDLHVGCKDLALKVNQSNLKLCVFGHIHPETEGPKTTSLHGGALHLVNASVVNNQYKVVYPPIYVNL
jgi:predicted phosphohydrolase